MLLLCQICCCIFEFILSGVCRGFLNLNMCVFHQIWGFFSHFFKYFPCTDLFLLSFWCSNNITIRPFNSVLLVPEDLFFFLFFSFLFFLLQLYYKRCRSGTDKWKDIPCSVYLTQGDDTELPYLPFCGTWACLHPCTSMCPDFIGIAIM